MDDTPAPHKPKIRLGGRHFHLPGSALGRKVLGGLFVLGGCLGILPILGFWMIPLGLLVLSYEFAAVRRHRRRFVVWWERWRRPN